jgi:DNA-binding NtrC family response regulator
MGQTILGQAIMHHESSGAVRQAPRLSRTALIVEDDADQRWLIATLLQEHGLDTVECESAEAALATMLLRGREVCLVYADMRLSGVMDGVDLARELKMRWPHLVVVLASGNPGTRLVHMPPGVIFMPKPWQTHDLLSAADQAKSAAALAARAAPPHG